MNNEQAAKKGRFAAFFTLWRVLSFLTPIIALCLAFGVTAILIAVTGSDVGEAYSSIVKGAFGSARNLMQTVRYAIPVLLLGMSFSICAKGGFFAIGQEGQMNAAAVLIVLVNYLFPQLPLPVLVILSMVAGLVGGALLSLIPAVLKHFFEVNETTIYVMLNNIMQLLVMYLFLHTALRDPSSASFPKSIPLTAGIPFWLQCALALAAVILFYIVMRFTTFGFKLKVLGTNTQFARASGISVTQMVLVSAMVGGALAGMASVNETVGVYGIVYNDFASGLGFKGVTAALLGRHNPIGMMLAALLLGALQAGSVLLSTMTSVSAEIVIVIEGFIMFFSSVSLVRLLERIQNRRLKLSGPAKGGQAI